MPRKRKPVRKPSQLDRIEMKVDRVVSRVDKLERKASLAGAASALIVAIASHLAGCF